LVITPEGTRSWVPKWRKGFYHMALESKVPIVIAAGDFKENDVPRQKNFGGRIRNSKLRKYYARITRLFFKNYTKISRKVESKNILKKV
jgi:1-acyl-sn-glycerol-3-phosphate acyltransferase